MNPTLQTPGTTTVSPGRASLPARIRRRRLSRLALGVAAAVALTVGVALPATAGVQSGRSASALRPASAVPAVPKYHVALNNPENSKSPDQVVVGDTLTGRHLATVNPPAHGTFGGVTGAADDRTFILDVRQFPWSPTWFEVTPRTWYLLRIAPGTAHPTRLTKLRIPASPNWADVDGMALSPDGSKLAVMYQPNAWGPAPGPITLRIYSVATGKALHTWVGPTPSPSGPDVYTFAQHLYLDDNATLSWTADGRGLAFVYGPEVIAGTTVRLLNLASPAHGLRSPEHGLPADSRLVLDLDPAAAPDCSSLLLTSDGRTVVCGASLLTAPRSSAGCSAAAGLARPGLDEFSATTGKLTSVRYQYAGGCLDGRVDVLWANRSGSAALGYLGITRQITKQTRAGQYATGVFTGGTFRPLPIRVAAGPPSAAAIAF